MYKFFFKRIFDLLISSVALMLLLPLFLIISIVLLFTGEHKIFYFQERIGLKNRKFKIWKFVTMVSNSPNIGSGYHTTTNDPRILTVGKFLRKTKINELPQIINIFLGHMSVVGPRPLVDKTFEPYPKNIKEVIYNIKPGLTGIGSIIFRDEEEILSKSEIPIDKYYKNFISPYKGKLELWYQRNLSFKYDMMIIFLTAWVIFFPDSRIYFKIFKDLPKNERFK